MSLKENYLIKIAMCDDDLNSIKLVAKMIESEIITQGLNAELTLITDDQSKILDAVNKRQVDVLILDVDFKGKGKNGLDFASELRNINKEFFLIYLSAHQRYMHVSFCTKAFDYLVKPLNKDAIQEVISRLKDEFKNNKKLFLKLNKWVTIRIEDILYIEKEKNKCTVVTRYGKESTVNNLDTLLGELPSWFRKCHRSYILNINNVIRIDKKVKFAYFSKTLKCPINSYFEL